MKWILIALMVWSNSALAVISDTTIGNGGDVIQKYNDSVYYLLDLFEVGLEYGPIFDRDAKVTPDFQERAVNAFFNEEVAKLVGWKLGEIAARDKLLGYSLLRTLELLRWKPVHYKLKNVEDEGTVYSGELYQAAIRQGTTIFIQTDLWNNLKDNENRAALVLHELIYALYKPENLRDDLKVQRSYRVREINSYFFDTRFRDFSAEEFYRMVDEKLPTSGNTGLKFHPENKNDFSFAPMISVGGYFIHDNTMATIGLMDLRSWAKGAIDEVARINQFCSSFSENIGLSLKSGIYSISLNQLNITLKRDSYNSPMGILDYINWNGDYAGYHLPPYGRSRVAFPRPRDYGETYRYLKSEVIYDFNKYGYDSQKSWFACRAFLESGLKDFGSVLNEYQ